MKHYYALKHLVDEDLKFFSSAWKVLHFLEEIELPANKCKIIKIYDVQDGSPVQNYLKTHQTKTLSYEELKDDRYKEFQLFQEKAKQELLAKTS